MLEFLGESRGKPTTRQSLRWRSEGHPVRVALVTWPMIACLGATVAAAACMIGDCGKRTGALAKQTRVGHSGLVRSIAYRSDGKALASVGVDGSMVIWNLSNCVDRPFLPEAAEHVRSAAFSPDNRVLATGKLKNAVSLHDLADGKWRDLDDPAAATAGAVALAFAPDGTTLAVGQQDGKISLWSAATGGPRTTLAGHDEFVASLAFSQDGATLATSGGDQAVRIWDLPAGRQRFSITSPGRTVSALSISPDGQLLALGDHVSPVVRIWNLRSRGFHRALSGPSGSVVALAISADGTTLAAADLKGHIIFWDLATLEILPAQLSHSGARTLAFAPDGQSLATGGFDGTIKFWQFPFAPVGGEASQVR